MKMTPPRAGASQWPDPFSAKALTFASGRFYDWATIRPVCRKGLDMSKSIDDLIRELSAFAKERDWDQFHSPKNLAMALASEAGEILEIFRWLTPEESRSLPADELAKAKDEIGDVLIFLARLADSLGIAPLEAAFEKLEKSKDKYPVEMSRGNAKKYSEFER